MTTYLDEIERLLGEAKPGELTVDGPRHMDISGSTYRIITPDRFPVAFVPAWNAQDIPEDAKEALANAKLHRLLKNNAPQLLAIARAAEGCLEEIEALTFDSTMNDRDKLVATSKLCNRVRTALQVTFKAVRGEGV